MSLSQYCRTCGQHNAVAGEVKPIFTNGELSAVVKILRGWYLDIEQDDNLPQVICGKCELVLLQIGRFLAAATEAKKYLETLFSKESRAGLSNKHNVKTHGEAVELNEEQAIAPEFETIRLDEMQMATEDETNLSISDVSECLECTSSANSETSDIQSTISPNKSDNLKSTCDNVSSKQFRCNYCMDKVAQLPLFSTAEQLEQHVAAVHDDSKHPYNCPHCPARYQTKSGCQLHINAKHLKKTMFCHVCGKQVCGGIGKMREHIERNHTHADYTCDICHLVMKNVSLYSFNYHKRWHKTDKLRKCEYCEKIFVRRSHLLAHQITHTKQPEFLCTECGKSARGKWELRSHLYAIHGVGEAPLTCSYCDQKFAQYSHRRKHLERYHPHELAKRTIACKICHRRFQNEVNLERHLMLRHKTANVEESTTSAATSKEFFQCPLCPRKFRAEYALTKHAEVHSMVGRPYPCDECDMSFKQESLLNLHKNQHHTVERPFKCSECFKAFSNKSALSEHMKTHSINEKSFHCTDCDQKFKVEKSLKLHQLLHSKKMRPACDVCGKLFISKAQLNAHINRYHKLQVDIENV